MLLGELNRRNLQLEYEPPENRGQLSRSWENFYEVLRPDPRPTNAKEEHVMESYLHYINGEWTEPSSGKWFETINPYTGEVWAKIPHGNATDVEAAVAAAKTAFESGWSVYDPHRGRFLFKLADLLERNAEHLAEIEVRDNGKLMAEMLAQMRYIPEWYRYYGGLVDKIEGAIIPNDKPGIFNFTRYEPLGTVGLITPWNSPLLLMTFKLAPALAAGNTVIVKPSKFTSASTLEFMKLVDEAGFPKGVVNAVAGPAADVGMPLVENKDVARIAFTGSTASGQEIYQSAARTIKHVTLELGGKSPNIVFEDADLEAAVMGAISGIFAATGQTCIAGSRLLLQRSIHDRFVERLVEVAKTATIGDPMSLDTHVGPVTTPPQYKKVLEYIEIAKREGATCVLGGGPYSGPGAKGGQFVEPTIFTNVDNSMRIAQEEVFGPVLSVIPFDTEEDAVRIGNDVDFGLAAGVWTQDIGRAIRMSEKLRAGTIWINTYRSISYTSPFGGYKSSGIGRENGPDAIKEYMQVKSVWIAHQISVQNPFIIR